MNIVIRQQLDKLNPTELATLSGEILSLCGWLTDEDAQAFFAALDTDIKAELAYVGCNFLDERETDEEHAVRKGQAQARHALLQSERRTA